MPAVYQVSNEASKRIRAVVNNVKNSRQIVRQYQDIAARVLADKAPIESGLLRKRIQEKGPIRATPDGHKGGVGHYSVIGDPDVSAPSGTIADFLKDNPQFRTGLRGHRPQHAWWALPYAGRQVLDMLRDQTGAYGGAQGGNVVPAYWYLQEMGTYPAPKGGRPKGFVEKSYQEIERRLANMTKSMLQT